MEGIENAIPSVEMTETLLHHFKVAIQCENIDNIKKKDIEQYCSLNPGASVPFQIVRTVFHALKNAGENVYLHEMLKESDLMLPSVKLPPRDPELEARIQLLKDEESKREYRQMTKNVDATTKQEIRFQEDVKSLNRQIIAMFNFVLTVVGAFVFGYKGVEVAFGTRMFPLQMMSGLILGTVVFFADLYFLIKYSPD